jgi:hypothetical protein
MKLSVYTCRPDEAQRIRQQCWLWQKTPVPLRLNQPTKNSRFDLAKYIPETKAAGENSPAAFISVSIAV